jgi:very-short-patch-repair endonuclease
MWDDHAGLPPFRRRDAADYGLTDADVRRLLEHGVLVRLAHGLLAGYRRRELAIEDPKQVALRVQAMQRRYPIGVAGYRTAAALHELWITGFSGPVHLLRSHGRPREKHDVWVETVGLPPDHRCVVQGVVATTIARTAVDLSQRCQAGEALAVVDSALRADATVDELLALCDELEVDAGSSAREVIAIGDRLSGSALESMSSWLVHARKLPRQVSIGDDIGPFAVVDFYWREAGVIGEADGLLKYDESPDALRKEKLRQERLERLGFIVVRWTFDDVLHRPDEVVARLREALRRGLRNRARVTGMSCGWAAPTLAV